MQKNFAVFIVACLAIIMGWLWLQNQLWPPPRPDQKLAKKDDLKKADTKKDDEKKKDDAKKDDKKETKPPEIKAVEPKPEIRPKPAIPEPPAQTVTLGNANTHLQVVVTSRGAGVQQLILNRFKAADYLGKPVDRNLELIPEDPHMPSFLMYHFADADAAHPVFGLGEKTWTIEGKGKETLADGTEEIRFSARVPGREDIKITKTYRLKPKDYHLGLALEIHRDAPAPDAKKDKDAKDDKFRYQLMGARGLPVEGEWYTSTYRKALIGMVDERNTLIRDLDNEDSFRLSHMNGGERVPRGSRNNGMLLYAGVVTQYFGSVLVVDEKQTDHGKNILAWARPTLETTEVVGTYKGIVGGKIDFDESKKKAGARQLYELLPHVQRHIDELDLKAGDPALISYYETPDGKRVATWIRAGTNLRPFLDDITTRVNSEPVTLPAGGKVTHEFLLYHGPVKTRLLGQFSGNAAVDGDLVDRYTETLQLRSLTDYRMQGPFGAFANSIGLTWLLIATTKLMHWLLYWLSFLVFGNYGLSIMLLTVIVRGAMFPISKKQAMFSIRMQALAPELKKMGEKYKNDPQGKTQATMELYRKHNVHPLGGCLPLFLQLPIFLGLYYALQESIGFRLAGFLWMDNLAAPDMLLWWTESIPLISHPDNQGGANKGLLDVILGLFYLGPYLNLLPLFAVTLMVVQQRIMTPPPTDDQQALNFKVMQYMMIFMGLVFYKVASGLCIYFIASSLWGLAERKLLPKKKTGSEAVVAVSNNGKAAPTKGKGKQTAKPAEDGVVQKAKDWWADLLEKARKK